jgi:tetratricopeptide (TPR) repeat protein
MSKHWTPNELSYLKRFAAGKRIADLAQRFGAKPDEVKAKLAELKLHSKEGPVEPVAGADPMVAVFEAGLKALYSQRWAEAEQKLAQAAAGADMLDLKSRARQMLAVCRQRRDTGSGPGERSDPYLAAVVHKNRGEYDEALALASRGAAASDERFLYLAASIYALTDRAAEAVKALSRAIEANPVNRVHAFHDPDFAELRRDADHAHLFGLG